jgi:hypothetical protein
MVKRTTERALHWRLCVSVLVAVGILVCAPLSWAAETKPDAAKPPAAKGVQAKDAKWTSLFDGKKLGKWQILEKDYDYRKHGLVQTLDGCLVLGTGQPMTGVRWSGDFPKMNYELALETKRVDGGDFFCGLTFPVGDEALTLIMGGWGGWVCGLSCLEGERAVDNETCMPMQFENDRWYKVRLRVTPTLITIWIDDEETITLETKDRKLSVTWEMEPCLPLGIATYVTTGAQRNIRYRKLTP